MKIRLDFVTNSSSSSFVCAFCNKFEYGPHDEEIHWVRCNDCGATYEVSCSVGPIPNQELHEKVLSSLRCNLKGAYSSFLENTYGDSFDHYRESITKAEKLLENAGNYDWFLKNIGPNSKLSYLAQVNRSAKARAKECPICNLDKLYDSAILSILLHRLGKTREQVTSEAKAEFGTMDNMRDEIDVPNGGSYAYS